MTGELLGRAVEDALGALGLTVVANGAGEWRADVAVGAGRPVLELVADAEAGGRVLALRASPAVAFAASLRRELLEAVNHWHQVQRWPRLAVRAVGGALVVEADAHIVVVPPAGGDGLVTPIAAFLSGCLDFWDVFGVPTDERSALEGVARIVDRGWGG